MNVGKVPIAMSELRAEFGLSLVTAGWVSSTINALAITMALLFGVLCDRLGALRMCLTGLGFGILGGLGTSSGRTSKTTTQRHVRGTH